MKKITLIPGDGVGPQIIELAKNCVDETNAQIEWETIDVYKKDRKIPCLDDALDSIKKNKIALKGPITTPMGEGFRSVNVQLRKELDLYACVRPCKTYTGVSTPFPNIDIVIIRENTEGLYSGIEFEKEGEDTQKLIELIKKLKKQDVSGSGLSIKSISEKASRRISNFAFEYAGKNQREKITCVTKSNIMKETDGLFQKTAEKISGSYNIQYEHKLVDNLCQQLVVNPQQFDIILAPNLYGDIISDLTAGLIGGLGMAPGANIGDEYMVFEATHGSAPEFKDKDILNPTAIILSTAMMLKEIGEEDAAKKINDAVTEIITERKYTTYDINRENPSTTSIMGGKIVQRIREKNV